MKFISLDRRASELAISDDGYEQVLALIQASLVCGKCQLPYTEDNPCVGSNLCLSCLLVKQSQLTFMGRGMAPDGREGEPTYWFVDENGYVFLAVAGLSTEAERSIYHTLQHWDFPVPTDYVGPKGETKLWQSYWNIYGQVNQASVVVIEYSQNYGDRLRVAFLSHKNSVCKELTKKDPEGKRLLKQAREMVEATKDAEGYYHVNGSEVSQLLDTHTYGIISALESAVYNVQLSFTNNNHAVAR